MDFFLFLPETVLLGGSLAVFLVSVSGSSQRLSWASALLSALGAVIASAATLNHHGQPFFPGIFVVDLFSQLIKLGLAGGLFLVLLLCRNLPSLRPSTRIDLPIFLLLSSVGMMLLCSATELLTIYVSLELAAYGLYAAVALRREPSPGSEAAAKYVIFGIVASGTTLYGLSLVFGLTGTTYLVPLANILNQGASPLLSVALLLVLSALFYKLAVFPLHFWVPDVYQGAPHQVVTFVATSSKLAAIAIVARVCALVATPGMLFQVFAAIAVVSMTLGNLAAIRQTDLKRLLGYSAVAQSGYMMLGYCVFSEAGLSAVIFYGLIYLVMVYLAFVVVCAIGEDGKNPTFDSLAGLHRRSPVLALMLMTAMFALGGIPPTSGFVGKWFLFAAALEKGQFNLVLIAAINGTISLYYYLRVVRAAYLVPGDEDKPSIPLNRFYRLGGYAALAATIAIGIYPDPLFIWAQAAASTLLGTSADALALLASGQ